MAPADKEGCFYKFLIVNYLCFRYRKCQVQLRARKASVAVSTQLVRELQDMGVKATLKV